MYKKSRISSMKHRRKQQKRAEQRKTARRLLAGDITLAQAERLAGDGFRGVLRTTGYLGEQEGVTLTPTLASAVAQAVSPATGAG